MVAGKKNISLSQSSSSHPVALTQAQLPRVPKRKKGSSPNDQRENKLAKRFCSHKELCSHKDDEQDDKEHSLSNKQASSSSQSNAPHPAALTKKQQQLVDEIRSFGRLPKCIMGASADDRYEYNLYQRYYRHKDKLPEDLLQEDDKADALDTFNFQLLPDFVLLSLC